MKMYGREYVWILNPDAGTLDDWMKIIDGERIRNNTKVCTREQYQQVLDTTFLLAENDLRQDANNATDSGLVRKLKLSKSPELR